MYNISVAYPQKAVLFDHYSAQLLVLSIKYFKKGMYVSDRNDWPLLYQNLVLNDAYPLAKN